MILVEYRIVLPMTLDEYYIAQLYAVSQASINETGGGDGLEVLVNDAFDVDDETKKEYNPTKCLRVQRGEEYKTGQYTHKIYHMTAKAPRFVQLFAPKGSLEFHEKAWNAYPYIRTVITNPYMKSGFILKIESMHMEDRGKTENVHGLTCEQLSKRIVINIDIANDPVERTDYKPEEDPTIFVSQKLNRGPLKGNWQELANPVMCCYKLVTAEFKWFGFQNKVESMISRQEKRIFNNFHRQLHCWSDIWADMTIEDIRKMEDQTKEALDQQRSLGCIRGTNPKD